MERPHDLVFIAVVFMTCLLIMKAVPYVNSRRRQRQNGMTGLSCWSPLLEKAPQLPSPGSRPLPQVSVGSSGPLLTLRKSIGSIGDRVLSCFLGTGGNPQNEGSIGQGSGSQTRVESSESLDGFSSKLFGEVTPARGNPLLPNSAQTHSPGQKPPVASQRPSPPTSSGSRSPSGRGGPLLGLRAAEFAEASLAKARLLSPRDPGHLLGPGETIRTRCCCSRARARLHKTRLAIMRDTAGDPTVGQRGPRPLPSKPWLEYSSKSEISSRSFNPDSWSITTTSSSSPVTADPDCCSDGVVGGDREALSTGQPSNQHLAQGSRKISADNLSARVGDALPNPPGGSGTTSASSPPPGEGPTSGGEFVEISLEETPPPPPETTGENKRTPRSGLPRSLSGLWAKVTFNCGQDPAGQRDAEKPGAPGKTRSESEAEASQAALAKTPASRGREEPSSEPPWFRIPALSKVSRLDLPWGRVLTDLLFQEMFRPDETSKGESLVPAGAGGGGGRAVAGEGGPSKAGQAELGNRGNADGRPDIPLVPFYSKRPLPGRGRDSHSTASSPIGFSHQIRHSANSPSQHIPV